MERLVPLPGSPGCVICDNNASNPRSLKLCLFWDETNRQVRIPCEADESWCGYDKVVHGGIVAALLDEAMAWAVRQHTGDWAFTAECSLRFKQPVRAGKAYTVIGGVSAAGKRKITAYGCVLDAEGAVAAKASASFLPAKGRAKLRSEE